MIFYGESFGRQLIQTGVTKTFSFETVCRQADWSPVYNRGDRLQREGSAHHQFIHRQSIPHLGYSHTDQLAGAISETPFNTPTKTLVSQEFKTPSWSWSETCTCTCTQVFTDNEERPGEKRIYSLLFDNKHDRLFTGELKYMNNLLIPAKNTTMTFPDFGRLSTFSRLLCLSTCSCPHCHRQAPV